MVEAKECWQPPESRKGKEVDFPLEPLEGGWSCQLLILVQEFSSLILAQTAFRSLTFKTVRD